MTADLHPDLSYPVGDEIELTRNPDGIWIGTCDWHGGESWYAVHATDAELAAAYGMTVEAVSATRWLPRRSLDWYEVRGVRIASAGGWIDSDWDDD